MIGFLMIQMLPDNAVLPENSLIGSIMMIAR
jgi:hypothetical protein